MDMVVIGIAGGSGSGKTTVVKRILDSFQHEVAVLSQDSYYRDNSHLSPEERAKVNFDHPNAIEWELLEKHLMALKHGQSVEEPIYDYISSTRQSRTISVHPRHVLLVEGILLFTDPRIRAQCDIKVFVDAEADDRLVRIMQRDIAERGRTAEMVIQRYHVVKQMHDQFIEPSKRYADLIIPQGGENVVAIDVLTSSIKNKLKEKADLSHSS